MTSGTIVNTIPTGKHPTAAVADEFANLAYVISKKKDTLDRISLLTGLPETSISVPKEPSSIQLVPELSLVLVTSKKENSLSFISTLDMTITRSVTVGKNPRALKADKTLKRAVTANSKSDDLTIVSLETGLVTATLPVCRNPEYLALHEETHLIGVSCTKDDSVQFVQIDVNPPQIIATVPAGKDVAGIAINKRTNQAIVASRHDRTISLIDLNTFQVVDTIYLGTKVKQVSVNPKNNIVIALGAEDDSAVLLHLSGYDETAPQVTVSSHTDGQILPASPSTISGTVDDPAARIFVNTLPATILSGTFRVDGITLVPGSNLITIIANDPAGNISTTEMALILNRAPTADAGTAFSGDERAINTLDATGSSDPDGQTLTYQWTQTSGPLIALSDTTSPTPAFAGPNVSASGGVAVFSLIVNDGMKNSVPVSVTVTIINVNRVPTANAGTPQTVNERTTVTLSALGSTDADNEALTYSWTQTSGPLITLSDAISPTPSFTAPEVGRPGDVLIFQLSVFDGIDLSLPDTTTIAVQNDNRPPVLAPIADITVNETETITISPIATDPDSDPITYTYTGWMQADTYTTTYDDAGTHTVTIIASDGELTDFIVVNIIVNNLNRSPTASAGVDQTVDENTLVTLNAAASTDPDNDALTYSWTQTAGSAVTLSDSTASSPTFTAPDVGVAGETLSFSLVVSDGTDASPLDTITIQVINTNSPPVLDPIPDITVKEGETIIISPTAIDPEGDTITYAYTGWMQTNTYTTTYSDAGTYAVTISASDGEYTSSLSVSVTVLNTNQIPIADAGINQTVVENIPVTLNSQGSSDPDGDTITYSWLQIMGSPVILSDVTSPNPTFTSPTVTATELIVFLLTVNDGLKDSVPSYSIIQVNQANDTTPPVITIASPLDGVSVNTQSITISGSVDDYSAQVTINSTYASLSNGVFNLPAPLVAGTNTITITATDQAQNSSTKTLTAILDQTPPVIQIVSPLPDALLSNYLIPVQGISDEPLSAASVNNTAATITGNNFLVHVLITEGVNTLTIQATDLPGNNVSTSLNVTLQSPPTVTITSPADLATVGSSPIDVCGTVNDQNAIVTLNGIVAAVTNNSFCVAGVVIKEGLNSIAATAVNAVNHASTYTISITLDSTPPKVAVLSPPDGLITSSQTITITGMINDIVRGTVNQNEGQVVVNGTPAVVSNRNFTAQDVPLTPGSNLITITGSDQVGNVTTKTLTITYDIIQRTTITIHSGNNQSAFIKTALPDPLVVRVEDAAGLPIANRQVIFRVVDNNGTLDNNNRAVATTTGAGGLASAYLTLGSWAGSGNNRVEASATGIVEKLYFTASGNAKPASAIYVGQGNQQKGGVNQPLPEPFVAYVTDDGHNPVQGVNVVFTATKGGGVFPNTTQITIVPTDSDGRAAVTFTLGPKAGNDEHQITAKIEAVPNKTITFTATGLLQGNPGDTSISGVVLDNSNMPIPGVSLHIEGTQRHSVTDAQGQFTLTNVPVGPVHLIADGSTAGTIQGIEYPVLSFNLVTVSGADNRLNMPVYLLPIDTNTAQNVGNSDTVFTLPEIPGFSLTIKAGSVTFPDGSKTGNLSVTQVHSDKVPMVPQNGMQPGFIVTIQPPGVVFDPPAPLTLPNSDGLSPGQKTSLFSFDHDLGQFVSIGAGTVSEDGMLLVSDPGVGVVKSGWHCGSDPDTSCDVGGPTGSGATGSGATGSGATGSGSTGSGSTGSGSTGTGSTGSGSTGSGSPGTGSPGTGSPGSGSTGSGSTGSGSPGTGTPGSGTPGTCPTAPGCTNPCTGVSVNFSPYSDGTVPHRDGTFNTFWRLSGPGTPGTYDYRIIGTPSASINANGIVTFNPNDGGSYAIIATHRLCSVSATFNLVVARVTYSPNPLYMGEGTTANLTAAVSPSYASGSVTFNSTNPAVISLPGNTPPDLLVNANTFGSAWISSQVYDSNGFFRNGDTAAVQAAQVNLLPQEPVFIGLNSTVTLTATVELPLFRTNITFTSEDPAIAIVGGTPDALRIAGVSPGVTFIEVRFNNVIIKRVQVTVGKVTVTLVYNGQTTDSNCQAVEIYSPVENRIWMTLPTENTIMVTTEPLSLANNITFTSQDPGITVVKDPTMLNQYIMTNSSTLDNIDTNILIHPNTRPNVTLYTINVRPLQPRKINLAVHLLADWAKDPNTTELTYFTGRISTDVQTIIAEAFNKRLKSMNLSANIKSTTDYRIPANQIRLDVGQIIEDPNGGFNEFNSIKTLINGNGTYDKFVINAFYVWNIGVVGASEAYGVTIDKEAAFRDSAFFIEDSIPLPPGDIHTTAHETGHAYSLGHTTILGNLMEDKGSGCRIRKNQVFNTISKINNHCNDWVVSGGPCGP